MPGRVLTTASLNVQLLAQMSQENKAENTCTWTFPFSNEGFWTEILTNRFGPFLTTNTQNTLTRSTAGEDRTQYKLLTHLGQVLMGYWTLWISA